MSEEVLNTMCIGPSGIIFDVHLDTEPILHSRITIDGKNYRISEVHSSASERWSWVITLAY